MTKIRWGVLSTAAIGVEKVIPAMQRAKNGEVVAIASRDGARARQAADSLGIATAHGSYEALLADNGVDAVYNPLPNHLHVPWTIRALEAGKHVLCEKPIGLSTEEAQQLIDAAADHPRLKVMEAFMYRFHPQWRLIKQLVQEEAIGKLITIQSIFSYFMTDSSNVRNRREWGGGAIMDIGCYPISLARWLFEREPQRVVGTMIFDPDSGVDTLTSGVMDFGSEQSRGTATFTSTIKSAFAQNVRIYGTSGLIEIEIPFNAPPDRACRLWLTRSGEREEHQLPAVDQYTLQGEAFAQAIINDEPVPTPLSDARANMRVIDAFFESARDECWVALNNPE